MPGRARESSCVRRHFGYWLGEPHWGKGVVTAAGRALLEYLKADARFARLEAPVFEWNPSSMRVLEKLGFERVALLRKSVTKDGQLIDSVLYTCLLTVKEESHAEDIQR